MYISNSQQQSKHRVKTPETAPEGRGFDSPTKKKKNYENKSRSKMTAGSITRGGIVLGVMETNKDE